MKSRFAFFRLHVVPALICFGVAWLIAQTGFLRRFEFVTADLRAQWRMRLAPQTPTGEVVVLAIDQDSLEAFGRWPWERTVHGALLQMSRNVRPSVVTWDILFTEATPQDAGLVEGITTSGTAVLLGGMRVLDDEGTSLEQVKNARLQALPHVEGDRTKIPASRRVSLPPGDLSLVASLAFVDTPADLDGSRRRVPLFVAIDGKIFPTLSLKSLMLHWQATPENVRVRLGESVTIEAAKGSFRIPIDETGAFLINYRYALSSSLTFSYQKAFGELRQRWEKQPGEIPPIAGKIVLIGQTADALSDIGPTPMSELTPLVYVHANAIENIIAGDYARVVLAWPIWLGGLVLAIAGVGLAQRALVWQAAFSLGLPLAYVAAAVGFWLQGSWLLPIVGPLLGFGATQVYEIGRRVLAEQRAKEQIKGAFGAYLSPMLVERLAASGQMPRLGGHEVEITAYFSDIQGFSTFSEKMTPDRLVELMNEYLTVCTDIVQEEGGTLDKYIGDAVVAMYGAPIALNDHAYRACVSAVRVQQRLGELRTKWKSEGDRWPEIVGRMQSRIGLNSGPCIVGNMGSRVRFNYTMMGDDVNLAARMESGAKTWGVYVMCTAATKLACEQHGGDRVVFRALGKIKVMGRDACVPIFEVVGLKESIAPATRECVALFEDGLARYLARDWPGAMERWQRCAELEPNQPGKTPGVKSNPSLIFLALARRYAAEPPPPEWDGTETMTEK